MTSEQTLRNLKYQGVDGLIIQAEKLDGSFRIIEPTSGKLWEAAIMGDFGPIAAYIAPLPATPAEILATERATMVCTPLQGRLVLGEATCTAIDAVANNPATPWAMRQSINNAIEWKRNSQAITELGYLLGYTDTQMDDLFRVAMTVQV